MNPEYLQALWTFAVTVACYVSVATELISPNFETMSPQEVYEAIAVYDEMIRLYPENPNAYATRGAAWATKKEFGKAISDFDTVISLAASSADSYFLRAMAWNAQKNIERAMADYDEAIRLNPKFQRAYFHRGSAWGFQKNFDKALADFDEAIRLNPDHGPSYNRRGWVRMSQRKLDLAILDFSEAIRLDPDDWMSYENRGCACAMKHDRERAFADYAEAIRLNPQYAKAYRNRAALWCELKDWDKAIRDWDEAIRIEPSESVARSRRGWLWHAKGNLFAAISDYDEALRLHRNDAFTLWCRAIAMWNQQDFGGALIDGLIAQELNPEMIAPDGLEYFAHRATRAAERTLTDRNDQNRDDIRFSTAYLERGLSHFARGRWDSALRDLDESIRLDPNSPANRAFRGRVWLKKLEWDRAIDDFDAAIRLNPDDSAVWNARRSARMAKQDWAAACEDYSTSIRLDPTQLIAYVQRGAALQGLQEWDRAITDDDHVTHGAPRYIRVWRDWMPDQQDEYCPNKPYVDKIDPDENEETETERIEPNLMVPFLHLLPPYRELKSSGFFRRPGETFENRNSVSSANRRGNDLTAYQDDFSPNPGTSYDFRLDPNYLTAYRNRAKCWEAKREWAKVLSEYQELIHLDPGDSKAYRRIAWVRATCPDPQWRNGTEAVRFAMQAIEIANIKNVDNLATLAAAYAESGDFEKAVECQSEAHEIAIGSCTKELQESRGRLKAKELLRAIENDEDPAPANSSAIDAALKDCEQSAWKDVKPIEVLANAYADAGQFEQAIECQEKAYALKVVPIEKPFLERLELYHARKLYRDERLGAARVLNQQVDQANVKVDESPRLFSHDTGPKVQSLFGNVERWLSDVVKLLAERLNDPDGRTRLRAAEALIRDPDWWEPALNTILVCLKHQDKDVRWYATYSLAELAPESPEAVVALLKAAHDPVSKVRVGAVYALGEIGPFAKDTADELRGLSKSTTDEELKLAIHNTLIQFDGPAP